MDTAISPIARLLDGNRKFATQFRANETELHEKLSKGQAPETLWLGCADSRVPETTILSCRPGDIFVHRNIANVITAGDSSASAVIAYSVGVVKVKRIIVCGHTKCGGANASLGDDDLGDALNSWLEPVRDIRRKNKYELDRLDSVDAKMTRLAELNALNSVEAVKKHPVVKKAMEERGLTVHAVLYDIPKAEVKELEKTIPTVASYNRR